MKASENLELQLLGQRRVNFLRNSDRRFAQSRQTGRLAAYVGYNAELRSFVVRTPGNRRMIARDVSGGAPSQAMRVQVAGKAFTQGRSRGN